MTKKWKVAFAAMAVIAASCGSDDATTGSADLTNANASAETGVETEVAGETEQAPAPQPAPDRPEAFGDPCGNGQLPALEQMQVNASSGLRARRVPGDGEVLTVLANGTVVDTFGEAEDCGVLPDGSVWFQIGTPLLATGGWVHSGFLQPANGVAPTAPDTSTNNERPAAFGDPCGNDQLPVSEQMVVSANGGLRARAVPGNGDVIAVLPTGTVVDTFGEAEDCSVLPDGSVWIQVGTPLLATGGWVHSGFLDPA